MPQTCDPVHGDALHATDAVGDHIFPPRLVSLRPADGAQTHVHPVDGVVLWEGKGGSKEHRDGTTARLIPPLGVESTD